MSDNDLVGVSVSGAISGIKTGNVSRDWTVAFKASPALTTANGPDNEGIAGRTEWSTGGAVKGTGDWSANMYGAAVTDVDGNPLLISTSVPTAVVGEFDAAIGDGTVELEILARLSARLPRGRNKVDCQGRVRHMRA